VKTSHGWVSVSGDRTERRDFPIAPLNVPQDNTQGHIFFSPLLRFGAKRGQIINHNYFGNRAKRRTLQALPQQKTDVDISLRNPMRNRTKELALYRHPANDFLPPIRDA
jgi:hypothetical protein